MDSQNMEDQNMTDQNQQGDQAQQQDQNQQGKTFTQDEVNRIVSERLARAKNTADHGDFTERENALNQREMRLDARERLADAGIPKDLLPLVDCSSKEKMESSINLISSYFGQKKARESGVGTYRISTGTAGNTNGSGSRKASGDEIRAAMGLKGKNRK